MSDSFAPSVSEILVRDLGSLSEEVAATPEEHLWATRPGILNSIGTLALHLCGNLRYFVGACVGGDGYVRDRDAEFGRRDVTRAALLAEIEATQAAVRQGLAGLDAARLASPMPDPPPRHAGRTIEFFLIQLACHLNWHRGHANYLRRMLQAESRGTVARRTPTVNALIEDLETLSKQGESYADGAGRHGWRNPIRRDTGELLHALVLAASPARLLEVGTGQGLSGLYLASALARPGAMMDTLELDPRVAVIAQQRFDQCALPVRVHAGDALASIGALSTPFDFVFLDAQKDQYLAYVEALRARQLLLPGATIVADNVIDRAAECRAFLEWARDAAVRHTVIPTECGLLVATL